MASSISNACKRLRSMKKEVTCSAGSTLPRETLQPRDRLGERNLRFSQLRVPLLFPFQGKIPVVATAPERGTRLAQRDRPFIEQAQVPCSRLAAARATIFDVDVSNS